MAGSKRWFNYTMDDGTNWGTFADESNVEALNGGAANPPVAAVAPNKQVPRGVRLRYAYYTNPAGTRTIRIPVLNQAIYNALPTNFQTIPDPLPGGGNATLTFVRKRPELNRVPIFAQDSGLTDGDVP